ncbi:carboxypeptidase-like regulatory domain-containing protein [Pedobacter frigiditerrae]|uniref:carboxypeptidase-like regulatory domain-containing protein n=1 Tax=Pedobacter frigiditerrae TaxID=2530452 RepID=UPI00292CD2B7|nr:carboxypeptidase-like regulatory domain-containing protein [Pedobacter frigiditerrae]
MKRLFVIVFFISFINTVKAQVLQGKIVDETTGAGIPFVSVGILGTNSATVSNESGDFILRVTSYPIKLRCSHVSYLLADLSLNENPTNLVVKLKPASISLNEVTIDPYKGQRLVKAALEKAKGFAGINFYANAFYRQLTTVNNRPSQIYELFYDLKWTTARVQGWAAKQSRFAELNEEVAFSMSNQSYLTFLYSGYLLPEKGGKFVSLATLSDYEISIDKYIEQENQKIAVVTCKYKKGNRNTYYVNSIYYIGMDDFGIYRLENSLFNLPMRFSEASPKYPPLATTIATFNGFGRLFPVLESVSTKLNLSLKTGRQNLNTSVSSLLTVFNIDDNLKNQQFETLNRKTQDKSVIESIRYDAAFWKSNPIVKQTTLEDSFIKMMESKSAFGTMTNP